MAADIHRHHVKLNDGRTLAVFLNRDINLLVVDVGSSPSAPTNEQRRG